MKGAFSPNFLRNTFRKKFKMNPSKTCKTVIWILDNLCKLMTFKFGIYIIKVVFSAYFLHTNFL